jgi:glycosyltransferase involved in cell wall biosynthesis
MGLCFSIVIPTLDRHEMLLTALASIRTQRWPDTEIIVVDGGSADGTIEDLSTQRDIHLIAGPDRGIYDAFNKGIARAAGDVVCILNSDDCYEPGTFSAVAAAFAAHPEAQAVCGTALVVADGRIMTTLDRDHEKALLSPRTALIGSCSPNARFFRRAAMDRVGPFSLDYRYVSDRDWLTRWYEAKLPTATIPNVVYRYQQHPGSLTFDLDRRHELAIREEMLRLARRWRADPAASAETKQISTLLEGRCIATLSIAALRDRRIADAIRWVLDDHGHYSLGPIASVVRSGTDWLRQRQAWN